MRRLVAIAAFAILSLGSGDCELHRGNLESFVKPEGLEITVKPDCCRVLLLGARTNQEAVQGDA